MRSMPRPFLRFAHIRYKCISASEGRRDFIFSLKWPQSSHLKQIWCYWSSNVLNFRVNRQKLFLDARIAIFCWLKVRNCYILDFRFLICGMAITLCYSWSNWSSKTPIFKDKSPRTDFSTCVIWYKTCVSHFGAWFIILQMLSRQSPGLPKLSRDLHYSVLTPISFEKTSLRGHP